MGRRGATHLLEHTRYAPGEVLGRGAQGVVMRVVDREAEGRLLVAKVFRPGAFAPAALLGEFALLSRLSLPGVVRAHDLGHDARTGAPFLVEDFVPGEDAASWVQGAADEADRNARLSSVCAGVAAALSGLHDAGFLHGDLKPAHVRMRPEGDGARPVLLDLGAAVYFHARAEGQPVAMSRGYAAPELSAGGSPSPRSDLYGLGALLWAVATGAPPPMRAGRTLRERAPWLRPSLAEVVEALCEAHPLDRPEDARAVLSRLGVAAARAGLSLGAPPAPMGRDREIEALLAPGPAQVRYLVGPSGAGKSHLARELVTRALCAGRRARLVVLPQDSGSLVPRLVAFFRGQADALPFALPAGEEAPMLLCLDGLEAGPLELAAALDAYRCRDARAVGLDVVATARAAPAGADGITLGPLAETDFAALCRALGMTDENEIAHARTSAEGQPGWLLASLGRVPLSGDAARARASGLSAGATRLLGAIAASGGEVPERVCGEIIRRLGGEPARNAWIGELLAASLIGRRTEGGATVHALVSLHLRATLAAELSTAEVSTIVADVWLSDPAAPAAALFSVSSANVAPAQREALLERAALAARADGRLSLETECLLALAKSPERRTPELLCRLERLVRDAGLPGAHPEVLRWLEEAAAQAPWLLPLSLRRRAEQRARAGDAPGARALAEEALAAARRLQDRAAEAFSRGTLGLVALFSANYPEAEAHLAAARAILAERHGDDPEELARIEHNAGVVALYRNRVADAVETFSRSLAEKRRLGDRAGMRSCLMNLGMALGRASRHAEACAALTEATLLSRSLGQEAGLGWCLFARAELEVRRGDLVSAARFVAEARALGPALPAVVRADLSILQARIRARSGDGAGAFAALGEVPQETRADDALVDVRARVAEVEAHLSTLPADPRRAARTAVSAVRRARGASLSEGEAEAREALQKALAARRRAEIGIRPTRDYAMAEDRSSDALWDFLACAARGEVPDVVLSLARLVLRQTGAERVFVAQVDSGGRVVAAHGVDLDGLALAEAAQRIDPAALRAALRGAGPVHHRDVATAGGRGSRLSVAGPEGPLGRSVVIAEHRFRPGCFDRITAAEAERWAILGALSLRLGAEVQESPKETKTPHTSSESFSPKSHADPPGATTVVPVSGPRRSFPGILGHSAALTRALARLSAALDSDLPVLIVGETGAGKEMFARALSDLGPRARRPFVAMNCGGVPDALFEAELFGHARGAFTGAERARAGLLSSAEGGTLLLDEIGELSPARQAALLRALETRRYRQVGSDEERAFDVRIVAATNRDLEKAVAERGFRQDLYYRLNAITLRVPPLRERAEDVPVLCRAFLERAGSRAQIAEDALEALAAYPWPGNVRELKNVMERLGALSVSRIERAHLPRAIRAGGVETREEDERAKVQRALAETGGNISRAAELLGLSRQGLKKRMVRLGLREPPPSSRRKVS